MRDAVAEPPPPTPAPEGWGTSPALDARERVLSSPREAAGDLPPPLGGGGQGAGAPQRPHADEIALASPTTVLDHRPVGANLFELWLSFARAASCQPGQFVHVRCGEGLLRRPFSFYRVQRDAVSLLYHVKGKGTRWMSRLTVGDTLDVLGPLGRGFEPPQPGDRTLLVGGGVGMAPLAHFVQVHGATHRIWAVAGFRSANLVAGLDPFYATDIPLSVFTDDGTFGRAGRVTDGLAEAISQHGITRVLTCGPDPMMRRVAEIARDQGVRCEVSVERPMGCGIGICLGCVVPLTNPDGSIRYDRACQEGPVFPAEAIAW